MIRTEGQWIEEYAKRDGLWIYSQADSECHAKLTSGLHSSGFFNSRKIIPDEVLLREAASDLVELWQSGRYRGNKLLVGIVVGPQTGATKLAEFVSQRIGNLREGYCRWASPAKLNVSGVKSMIFTYGDVKILNDQDILLCEDVMTTGESVELAARAIEEKGGRILPWVLTLVNRSSFREINCRQIVALIDKSMPTWPAEECPLCRIRSEAVSAKDNWDKLTGKSTYAEKFRQKVLDAMSGV